MTGAALPWKGKTWWIVLPETVRVREPEELARYALGDNEVGPEVLCEWLGGRHTFELSEAVLGRWKLALRNHGRPLEELPRPEFLLQVPPLPDVGIPKPALSGSQTLWERLVPLLGRRRCQRVLEFYLLPWRRWQSREDFHSRQYQAMQEFFQKNPRFCEEWESWTSLRRADFFSRWMSKGRVEKKELEAVACADWSYALPNMRDLWCGRLQRPTFELERSLAVGLIEPGVEVRPSLTTDALGSILCFQDQIAEGHLEFVLDFAHHPEVTVPLLACMALNHEETSFALEHRLFCVLQTHSEGKVARRYLRICRTLIEAGFPSRILNDDSLLMRAGRVEAFAYILLQELAKRPTPAQLRALCELCPRAGLERLREEPNSLSPELHPEVLGLAEDLELCLETLVRVVASRVILGQPPVPDRMVKWSRGKLQREKEHLQHLLAERPDDGALLGRLQNLEQRTPNLKEKKRCGEELVRLSQELPGRLWTQLREEASNRLLDALAGAGTAQALPRAGMLLRHVEVPLNRIQQLRQEHPANDSWLRHFERNGFCASRWLLGWHSDIFVEGKYIELGTETDAAEILEMGSRFKTCLSLEDGFNAFSVLTNLLEVNKMVLIGRDAYGKVMIRKLIGVNGKGELVGYRTYSHLKGARRPVHWACRKWAEKMGLRLSDTAKPERILHDLDWYNDGAEAWLSEELPDDLPADWPRDLQAARQWRTARLATGCSQSVFFPKRMPEFYHLLRQGHRPKGVPEPRSNGHWDDANEALICAGEYQVFTDPNRVGDPTCIPEWLDTAGGCAAEDVSDYLGLIDPAHPSLREETVEDLDFGDFPLSPCAFFASVAELRALSVRAAQADWMPPGSAFFNSFGELLFLKFLREPDDPFWFRFPHRENQELVVWVASQVAVAPWKPALARLTQERPRWGRAWLARARVEGGKILAELQERLSGQRHSLPLALAVRLAGGIPRRYILPRPGVLLSDAFLHQARILEPEIRGRLDRLEKRGTHQHRVRLARRNLGALKLEDWQAWPNDWSDPDLDAELSRQLWSGSLKHYGAWCRLGDWKLRLGLLRMLEVELEPNMRSALRERFSPDQTVLRDRLLGLWLGDTSECDGWDPTTVLAWRRWPELLKPLLTELTTQQLLELLDQGAELLEPSELEEVLEVGLGDTQVQLESVAGYLCGEGNSVTLQTLVAQRCQHDAAIKLDTPRGQWALGRLAPSGDEALAQLDP